MCIITSFLTILGAGCLMCFVLVLLIGLYRAIHDFVVRKKSEYKYKHRFDRPPIAKCYCRDCIFWDCETGRCSCHYTDRRMADNWFCYFAEPTSVTQMNTRDAMMEENENEN